ncbi:MAG: hypothetical protein U5L01_00880 [Rheinheimera sp.]|nr:hypothetical protein [Rheinheimera sp.]
MKLKTLWPISGWYANYQHQINDDLTVFIGLSALLDEVDAIEEHRLIGGRLSTAMAGSNSLGLMASQVTVPTADQMNCNWKPTGNCRSLKIWFYSRLCNISTKLPVLIEALGLVLCELQLLINTLLLTGRSGA